MANVVNCDTLCEVGVATLICGAISSGLGYGLAAATGIINPVHGAIYLGVNAMIAYPLWTAENYVIKKFYRGRDIPDWIKTVINVAVIFINFLASGLIASLILGAFGVPIAIGTALLLSAEAILIMLVAFRYALAPCCDLCCECIGNL